MSQSFTLKANQIKILYNEFGGSIFTAVDICSLPPETGPCRGYFPRYFYNPDIRECDIFIYGGCDGNENNFETLEECEWSCCELIMDQ